MILGFDVLPEYLKEMLPVLRHEFINIGEYTEKDMMVLENLFNRGFQVESVDEFKVMLR